MKILLLLLALGVAAGLQAEAKLALLGAFPEEKVVEVLSAEMAVDAHNAMPDAPKLRLAVFNGGASPTASVEAARKIAADPDVLAVVLHGEVAASPEVLQVLRQAGLAVVSASSWAQPRTPSAGATWLCPSQTDLAESAAIFARREAKHSQVAVVDDGSVTSTAAAKAFAARFRALGGKVPYEGTWSGGDDTLAALIHGLAAQWPQMVFYAGGAATAGRLVVAMKEEKSLKNSVLVGLPTLFEPAFFDTARLKSMRSMALFPCPDYTGAGPLTRLIGFAFPKTSPEYKNYVRFAYRRPERWTSMIYDATALATRAFRAAAAPAPVAVASAGALSPSAAAVDQSPAAQAAVAVPTREAVRLALLGIDGYRGIRGSVKLGPDREPAEPKAMVYFALNRVGKKEMTWRETASPYGPPF
ncbi:MAG TPA: ABC transporter substrate-binding protein [bacterium]|nr:ABC transporter substrate-binding protein [bacterium]